MGGLVMAHSDDKGLVLPPALAPMHVVIVPIFKTTEDLQTIKSYLAPELDKLQKSSFTITSQFLDNFSIPITIKIDDDDQKSPGWKYNEYELKGVPLRIAIGKRDVENGQVELYRRDTGEKIIVKIEEFADAVITLLNEIQQSLFMKHETFSKEHTFIVDTYEEFKEKIEQ